MRLISNCDNLEMPMKKIYTFFYSLNNIQKEENYTLELSEIEKNEEVLNEAFGDIEFSPSKGIIDNLLNFAKKK